MARRHYEATIQPDDNDDGSLWEVTCDTPTNCHLLAEGLSENVAKRLVDSLNRMESWEMEHTNG